MVSLECDEYGNLQRRLRKGNGDYSLGHRLMYETPIKLLTGKKRNIVEAGFGIGWGLDRMIEADILASYVGYEINAAAFNYVNQQYGEREGIQLHHEAFTTTPGGNHVFCIEVIEHVPMDQHTHFIRMLRGSGNTLWLSTPDKDRVASEGVRSVHDWKAMLKMGGYSDVVAHEEQWTTLYIAQ